MIGKLLIELLHRMLAVWRHIHNPDIRCRGCFRTFEPVVQLTVDSAGTDTGQIKLSIGKHNVLDRLDQYWGPKAIQIVMRKILILRLAITNFLCDFVFIITDSTAK